MQYSSKPITELMLNKYYTKNGVVFPEEDMARTYLFQEGFVDNNGVVKDKHGRRAYLHRLRDAIFHGNEKVGYKSTGWLVSFGGDPLAIGKLKYTKITTGEAL